MKQKAHVAKAENIQDNTFHVWLEGRLVSGWKKTRSKIIVVEINLEIWFLKYGNFILLTQYEIILRSILSFNLFPDPGLPSCIPQKFWNGTVIKNNNSEITD